MGNFGGKNNIFHLDIILIDEKVENKENKFILEK